jgi:hypothetical protein
LEKSSKKSIPSGRGVDVGPDFPPREQAERRKSRIKNSSRQSKMQSLTSLSMLIQI